MPSGSDSTSSKLTVCPGDTASGGIFTLEADLGSLGTLQGPEDLVGAESTASSNEMGNYKRGREEKHLFGVSKREAVLKKESKEKQSP